MVVYELCIAIVQHAQHVSYKQTYAHEQPNARNRIKQLAYIKPDMIPDQSQISVVGNADGIILYIQL